MYVCLQLGTENTKKRQNYPQGGETQTVPFRMMKCSSSRQVWFWGWSGKDMQSKQREQLVKRVRDQNMHKELQIV